MFNEPISLMSAAALLLVAAVIGTSCGDGGSTPARTGSATSSATAQRPPETPATTASASPGIIKQNVEAGGANGFTSFARTLGSAVARGDAAAVTSRMPATSRACSAIGVEVAGGDPPCKQVGDLTSGFPVARWRSEGGFLSLTVARSEVEQFFRAVAPAEKDSYGDGTPVIYAISPGGEKPALVITAILSRNGRIGRSALLFQFTFADQAWAATYLLIADVLAEDFLTPVPDARLLLPDWQRLNP